MRGLTLAALALLALRPEGPQTPRTGMRAATAHAGRVPLEAIRDSLAAGDTAWVIAQLTPRDSVTAGLDSRTLTDLLLLLWIGRTPGHEDALQPWRDAERMLRQPVDPRERSEAGRVLRAAVGVMRDESPKAMMDVFGSALWRRRVTELAASPDLMQSDPLLASAARWVLALDDMRQIERSMAMRVPMLAMFPPRCGRGGSDAACWERAPPPWAGRMAALFDADTTCTLDMLRADLDSARTAVWPYNAVGARVRVAVAALLGDRKALQTFAEDTAGLTLRDAAAARVTALAFGGRRGDAWREMAAHPEWYAGLDAEVGALGGVGMTPALFWRLAWPLYLQPYNERLVVHRARLLLADVIDHGMGDTVSMLGAFSNRTALVRRGIPRGLARARPPPWGEGGGPTVVSFIPPGTHETVVRLGEGRAPASLDLALAARDEGLLTTYSGYVAEDYDQLAPFDHQVVQYVRDGHRMVDIYAKRPMAPLCQDPHPKVGFFLLNPGLQMLREVTDTAPRRERYRFRMVLAPAVYIYSLELLDASCHLAARARYALTVPQPASTRLSDLVLADRISLEEPTRVRGDPLADARSTLDVSAGESLQFYWEAYGLDATQQQRDRLEVHFEVVNVTQQHVPLEQLGRLESVARHTKPLMDLQYRATVPPGTEPLGFGLSVTVPEGARGVYVARVTVRDRQTKWEETAQRALYVESGS